MAGTGTARHVPVLCERVVALLEPALREPGAVFVDATLGLGGHAHAVLSACPGAQLVGIDRDQQALALAHERLAPFRGRVRLVHAVYDQLTQVLQQVGTTRVAAVLMDLGVSSLQLDEQERGFSYRVDAPLDMRMDQSQGVTAAEVVNSYPAADLARILREYGEERFAARIAAAVVRERARQPVLTSARLVQIVRANVPGGVGARSGNPAKRTFQALRIEVNGELAALAVALPAAIAALTVGGRIAVLAYHSLEDRLVKQAFAAGARSTTPVGVPVELPGHGPYLRLLTRGATAASEEEIQQNPRAASARLRAAERVRPMRGAVA